MWFMEITNVNLSSGCAANTESYIAGWRCRQSLLPPTAFAPSPAPGPSSTRSNSNAMPASCSRCTSTIPPAAAGVSTPPRRRSSPRYRYSRIAQNGLQQGEVKHTALYY